jgi:trans-2-enoyl-CoA reductase
MTRQTLTPNRFFGWDADVTVQVEKVKAPAFANTAYAVLVDGEHVGYALSQRSAGVTYWGSVQTLGERLVASARSRDLVVTHLVTTHTAKGN